MKFKYLLMLIPIFLSTCEDKFPGSDVEACGVKDPVHNLSWLNKKINEAKKENQENILTVTMVTVREKQVINYYLSYMSCIGCVSYNCDGTLFDMGSLTDAERMEYQKNIWGDSEKRVVLWPEK
jgi:hypothetical protein